MVRLGRKAQWTNEVGLGRLRAAQITWAIILAQAREVQSYLQKEGIMVLVRQAGGLNVIVTFGNKGEMEVVLDQYYDIFSVWFENIKPYNMEKDERRYKVWVKIEELPTHLWNLKMFEAIGNCWGKFLKVDQETERRSRLDVAVIKVEIMSKKNVPVNQQIIVNGKAYIMRTSIIREESCDMERQACDEALCKAWACCEPRPIEQREEALQTMEVSRCLSLEFDAERNEVLKQMAEAEEGKKCGLGNIYAPNDERDRNEMLEELKQIVTGNDLCWVLGGDFNTVRIEDERIGRGDVRKAAA
ncbi:Uncharacterized protein TCM_031794 [Theobroma cacao]|uniref:Uncharacterized protein n=1 Tax=Theobroma cacao TaxID=3641 RepID=A0A061F7F8_THECC|nr:Uncharacterized protein TCM_031794 [Theobroma cacao]